MTVREKLWKLTEPTEDRCKVPTVGAVEAAADWLETWYGNIDKTVDNQLAIYQPIIGSTSEERVVFQWWHGEKMLNVYVSALYKGSYDMSYTLGYISEIDCLFHLVSGLIKSENDWLVLWVDFWK